jgi:zinc transport system ATP-binding protein
MTTPGAPAPASSAPVATAAVSAPVIALTNAAFGYGDRTVVSGVTASIYPGEVIALLGPNGSGKSTLVKGLLGLSDHIAGRVEVFGTPLERFRDYTRLGYVPQRHSLSASVRATAQEIVAIGRLPHRRWWQSAGRADAALVTEALDLVGLADRSHADVSTLSGGQQRRVLIARALAAQPEVLLMDEPTAGVDAANQLALARVLARLAERGTTMVIVTHELEALRPVVTRILCTSTGRVDFDGSVDAYEARRHHHVDAGAGAHHHEDEAGPDPDVSAVPGAGPLDPSAPEARRG